MCGIAGAFNGQAPQDVERMLEKIGRHGPDGRGIKNFPVGTLGHTRLAIIDVESGHQPMGFDVCGFSFVKCLSRISHGPRSLANRFAGLANSVVSQLFIIHTWHFDVDVNAV